MKVKYKGKYSNIFNLPGGGPQGTLLGLFLFLVLINDVGFVGQRNNTGELVTAKKKVKDMNTIHLKYVDDLALAESIDMTSQLKTVPLEQRPQPDDFRSRTGHQLKLEGSEVVEQLQKTQKYASDNHMKLNVGKTKLMLFNPCKNKDFMPDIMVEGCRVDLVEEFKLLGVVLSSNLSWHANTDYIVKRCNGKLWVLRRLKKLGASHSDLLDVYFKQIRSIAEFGVPVWNPSLTWSDVAKLERIQKTTFHIILGDNYRSYSSALRSLGVKKLSERRKLLCLKFARKAERHHKFSKWFKPSTKRTATRQTQSKYCQVFARKKRFRNSPIPYLTELLNNF